MSLEDAARDVRERAYAPLFQFQGGGAALRADTGAVFVGCNVENVAYPEGTCAEAGAIAAMIAGGAQRIAEIVVIADSPTPVPPCGGCRQKIAEFAGADVPVTLLSLNGRAAEHHGSRHFCRGAVFGADHNGERLDAACLPRCARFGGLWAARPDAEAFGDAGANTLGHIAASLLRRGSGDKGRRRAVGACRCWMGWGLGAAILLASGMDAPGLGARPSGLWGAATEVSRGKGTPSGHWELAGVPVRGTGPISRARSRPFRPI